MVNCANLRERGAIILQLPLQRFHFLQQGRVLGDQRLDLAHRVQHGGVIAPAEAAADLG